MASFVTRLRLVIAVVLCGFVLVGVQPVGYAQFNPVKDACEKSGVGGNSESVACENQSATADPISRTIRNVTAIVAGLAGIIAVVMVIYNGFRFITARGDANQVKAAQSGIIHAVVGIIVIALAASITFLFINLVG